MKANLKRADALIIGDYGKGIVTQRLLDETNEFVANAASGSASIPSRRTNCDLQRLSLAHAQSQRSFRTRRRRRRKRAEIPSQDTNLLRRRRQTVARFAPALLLITLGEQGMLLCQRGQKPFHIPTMAQEVFDVSGAGDTVIATFTFAIAAGASPIEAAIFSNHAAGIVVGKVGTATVQPEELLASFQW